MPLMVTAVLSLVLVGWRQRWWLQYGTVERAIALEATKYNAALSNGALAFCIAWALLLSYAMLAVIADELVGDENGPVHRALVRSWNPSAYFAKHPNWISFSRYPEDGSIEAYDKLFEM